MQFLLDENVPRGVADMLVRHGHKADSIRDYAPPGSPDPLVATVSQQLKAVLISFDGDFQNIAPRVPHGQRQRFRKLSRIWMRCDEPDAAKRLESALDFVDHEFRVAQKRADTRTLLWIGTGYLRTER
jgi:predicted nuclease of predicted toxin-antitoxin system